MDLKLKLSIKIQSHKYKDVRLMCIKRTTFHVPFIFKVLTHLVDCLERLFLLKLHVPFRNLRRAMKNIIASAVLVFISTLSVNLPTLSVTLFIPHQLIQLITVYFLPYIKQSSLPVNENKMKMEIVKFKKYHVD